MKQPTLSNITISFIEGDSLLFSNLEVCEISFNGESAEWENDAGMLEDAIAKVFKPTRPGTYFLKGFRAVYHRDYWGEVDVDFYLESWEKLDE